jgi:hypothetical protein
LTGGDEAVQPDQMIKMLSAIPARSLSADENRRIVHFLPRAKKREGRERRDESRHCDIDRLLLARLQTYDRGIHAENDYQHRMVVNLLAFTVTMVLIVFGVWLMAKISGA